MTVGCRWVRWACACSWLAASVGRAQTGAPAAPQPPPQKAEQPSPTAAPPPAERRPEPFTTRENWYDLNSPRSTEYQLDEIYAPHTAMFDVPFIDRPMDLLIEQQKKLEEAIGLRTAIAYTHLFQQASGGPGARSASAGDVDFLFDWTLVGRGTEDTGRFVFSFEERFQAGDIPPSQLRNQIGSLVATTGAFNDRGLVVRDAFWDQRFFDAKLRVVAGRGAPDDYVGSHRLQSANFGFLNGNLGGNPTMSFVGHGPLALASLHPTDIFYATVGGANAFSTTTQMTINRLVDDWRIYGFGEAGVTPEIHGLGRGRYAVTGWNLPGRDGDRPSDWGYSFTAEQYIRENLWVFGRYGWADRGLTGVKQGWAGGLAIDGLLGSPDNLTGIGAGYAEPASGDLRDETSVEIFHRFQLLRHTQFTLDGQLILNPSNAPDDDAIGIFSARLRLEF